jgi:translation initiation factor 2A
VDSGAAQEAGKRLRNLQKKLRQIQQLKEKQAAGADLEPEQVQKIATESALLDEIASLCIELQPRE